MLIRAVHQLPVHGIVLQQSLVLEVVDADVAHLPDGVVQNQLPRLRETPDRGVRNEPWRSSSRGS